MSISKNFRLATAIARIINSSAEMMLEDMQSAETEDDLFAIRTRSDQLKRDLARLDDINRATLENREFED